MSCLFFLLSHFSDSAVSLSTHPKLTIARFLVSALITELVAGARSEDEISASMVHALACVCKSAGKNLGDASKEAIEELVHETFRHPGLGELSF